MGYRKQRLNGWGYESCYNREGVKVYRFKGGICVTPRYTPVHPATPRYRSLQLRVRNGSKGGPKRYNPLQVVTALQDETNAYLGFPPHPFSPQWGEIYLEQ
jgi:hypothetical protein